MFLDNYSQGWMNAKPFKGGDQVWPGAAIAEIPNLDTLEKEGKLEEIDRGRVSENDEVRVRIDALPELSLSAELRAVSPLTQQSFEWPPTKSFRSTRRSNGRIRAENPDEFAVSGVEARYAAGPGGAAGGAMMALAALIVTFAAIGLGAWRSGRRRRSRA